MKLFEFLHEYNNQTSIVKKLREIGLLRTSLRCSVCAEMMVEKNKNLNDQIMFVCNRRTCRLSKSIRTGSFFEQSRLKLCECMLILHLWSKGYTEKLILDDFDFSNKTVIDWFRYCRELCVYHFETDDSMIGGSGCTVEIDETIIVKRKYNRGRLLRDGWLFGGIERRDDGQFKCFMAVVYNRSAPLLIHIIKLHVAPGTHIITDGWAAYSELSNHGYTHSIVIHEENFVAPEDPEIHTQLIESTWCSLKRFLRMRGTHKGQYVLEYICEWIFRRANSDVFESMLSVIRRKYLFHDD